MNLAKPDTDTPQSPPRPLWQRLWPLALIVVLMALFFGLGLHRYVSFDEIALRYGQFKGLIEDNPLLASLVTILIYAAATALSFPAAWLLTVAIGLLFGWIWGSVLVIIGATSGACVLFFIARYALADFFRKKAGPVLNKMADGFREDAVSYMMFLRLAPIFPFTLVNVVPAILGVAFPIFLVTTAIGIIPGVIAYNFAGEGLRSIIDERAAACAQNIAPCGDPLSAGDLVTPQIVIAFFLLSIVALLPVVLKRLRKTPSAS